MSLADIRKAYSIPAHRGAACTWKGEPARVISSTGKGWLRIKLECNGEWREVHVFDELVWPVAPAGGVVLTCAFCGAEYPVGTPSAGAVVLADHIRVCERHPMHELEARHKRLCAAVYEMIGCDTADEARELTKVLGVFATVDPDARKALALIEALIACDGPALVEIPPAVGK